MVLMGAALWNVLLTVLAAFHRRLFLHEFLVIAVDSILATLLFYLSGTLHGNLIWVGLLPVASTALYFRVPGALLISLASAIAQAAMALDKDLCRPFQASRIERPGPALIRP